LYFLALAADYDGTIADHGFVNAATCEALKRFKGTGRRLILVTGREIADLTHAFAELKIFDLVVAENGAVIYEPANESERVIAPAPSARLVEKLMERKVEPISVGRSIIATWAPHQAAVLSAIQELGLESQIIFNKGAVMVLPAGVNKASGLKAALSMLDIAVHNVIAVGDAENDHTFLGLCGCAAAVANALPAIRDEADIKLSGDHGAGVVELIQKVIREDARIIPPSRHGILVGTDRSGQKVYLEPDCRVLIAGESESGKSMFATLLTERMAEKQFEFCVIDPEGDYEGLRHAVCIGRDCTSPTTEEALTLVCETGVNLVINTVALNMSDRQRLFASLIGPMAELRARTGRPHWLLVDEAHQVLSAATGQPWHHLLKGLPATIFITVSPEFLAADLLRTIDVVLVFGRAALKAVATIAKALNMPAVSPDTMTLADDEIVLWSPRSGQPLSAVRVEAPRQDHKRHTGKYAVGDVGERESFYFRGPRNALNLRAPNLLRFLEIAQEVDDATWEYHLRAKHYSAWFRYIIKDEELAAETAQIEADAGLDPRESRARVRQAVFQRYVAPGQG
jgi:HAD superfamily hydrolase (TIGR01484 family)